MKDLINLRITDLIAQGSELEKQGKQLEQKIYQINGALQQCKWTLEELEKQDAAKEIDNPEGV